MWNAGCGTFTPAAVPYGREARQRFKPRSLGLAFWGRAFYVIYVVVMVGAGGCTGFKPLPAPESYRPLIERHNDNVRAVRPFQAKVFDWFVAYEDEEGRRHKHQHLGGYVLYVPGEAPEKRSSLFVRVGVPAIESEALVIGSNREEYWMYSRLEKQGYWGKYKHIGKECVRDILINPQLFLQYIGFRVLPVSPPDEYQITPRDIYLRYVRDERDERHVWLEVVFSRRDHLPRSIRSYTREGDLIVHSELGEYATLEDVRLPGMVKFSLGEDEFTMHLDMHGFRRVGGDDRKIDILLTRPRGKRLRGLEEFQQVDKACEQDAINDS